ncbi:MAG TPA: molybdenum cofactor guanylyltransferase [Terriglobales bacterium]|nr:molybdenum cofactor guanylyltransferase [Terriglobales bacterium]
MADLTAFVLAGGKSSRMGADKALLEVAGKTLLQRTLELARAVAEDVRIVGAREKFGQFAPVVEDKYPGRGPLGGIHAALASTGSDFNLILAVDLPFLENRFVQHLVTEACASGAVVTLPRAGGGLQPLCAVYRREFAALAEQALAAGRNKIDTLYAQTTVRIMEEDELARFAFSVAMFDNLNTQEEWERARQRLQAKS